MLDTLLQFKDLMTGSEDSKISKDKKNLNKQVEDGKKKKKKNKYDNNPDDLPRNLKINTTTNSSGTVRKFKMGGQSEACGCASCMGESTRGGGAAIRGMNFKGVF